MDSEVNRINRILKKFDRDLFCRRGPDGVLRAIQKVKGWDIYDVSGVTLLSSTFKDHHAFSLTDTWSGHGKPVTWGHEPISDKLRHIALNRKDELMRELRENQDRFQEKKEREEMANYEAIAEGSREVYKKAFSDTLTHSLDKSLDPIRKHDRRIHYGNSK